LFILSGDETQNICYNSANWNYIIFRATNKLQEKQYELQILNTTEEDLGVYVCEAQLNSITTETKVMLRLAGKII
jgi:hypothetical protein